MVRTFGIRVAVVGCTALAAAVTSAQPTLATGATEGSLDPSYGWVGGRTVDWSTGQSGLANEVASAVMPDGRVVAGLVSGTHEGGAVARYRADGTPDLSFGTNGRTVVNSGDPELGELWSIAVQPDGAVLIGGEAATGTAAQVIRYTSAGVLDTRFGSGGLVTLQATPASFDNVTAMAVEKDGAIIVGGTDGNDMFVARLTSSGQIDTNFGSGGYATAQANSSPTSVNDIAIDSGGRILTAGAESSGGFSGFALTRWNPDGSRDDTFGAGGDGTLADAFLDIESTTHDAAEGVAVQPDGKIVVVGDISFTASGGDLAVVRLTNSGARDTSFATNGVWTYPSSGNTDETLRAVRLQRDGKIVAVGLMNSPSTLGDYVIARLTTGGSPDPHFGTTSTGLTVVDFSGNFDEADSLGILRNGRIVVAGDTFAGDSNPSMLRLLGDLTPPTSPSMHALPRFSLAGSVPLSWSAATDDNTGVRNYDVLEQATRYNSSSLGPAGVYKSKLVTRKSVFTRSPGFTRCFVARARDYAGNVGVPGNQACTAFPVDDSAATTHGVWRSGRGSAYYLGTYRRSTTAGATLSVKVAFRHLAVVVTTCPGCGTAKVFLGKTLLKTVKLRSTSTHNRRTLPVASFTSLHVGTLRIVQASGGKPVTVDGIGVSYW